MNTLTNLCLGVGAACLLLGFLFPKEGSTAQWLTLLGGSLLFAYALLTAAGWIGRKINRRSRASNQRTMRCVSCGQLVIKPISYDPYGKEITWKCPHCGGKVNYF